MMRSARLRQTLVTVHVWLGLTIGALWAFQGLTGALLVFHREIDRMLGVAGSAGPTASADAIVAAARRAVPSAQITRLVMTDRHRDVVAVQLKDRAGAARAVLVDAASTAVLGDRELEPATPFGASAIRWIDSTHYALSAGAGGETLIAVSGFVLITAASTGLWIGWPRGRWPAAWRNAFAASRWRRRDQRLHGWHRALGLLLGLAFIATGLTGAQMNLEGGFKAALSMVLTLQQHYDPMASMHEMGESGEAMAPGDFPVSPQQAIDTAMRRFPQASWVRVFMPSHMSSLYSVRLHQPGELRDWLGATAVAVDAHTGAVINVYDALHAPLANRLLDAGFPIHNGEAGGLAGRGFVLLMGLSLPALYVTGVWAWLRRRRTRMQHAAVRTSPQAPRARRL